MKKYTVIYDTRLRRQMEQDQMFVRKFPSLARAELFPGLLMSSGWRGGFHPGYDQDDSVDFTQSPPILNDGGLGNREFALSFRQASRIRFIISLLSSGDAYVEAVFLKDGSRKIYKFSVRFPKDGGRWALASNIPAGERCPQFQELPMM